MADQKDQFLAPPVLETIRNEDIAARVRMERTFSQEIRDERADLKEAAEHSLNVIVNLCLDGTIRWASPSWRTVIGTPFEEVEGKAIGDVVIPDESGRNPFLDAIESMKQDGSKSQMIRFRVRLGPSSAYSKDSGLLASQKDAEGSSDAASEDEAEDKSIVLEGQGIMVHDRTSAASSHVSLVT